MIPTPWQVNLKGVVFLTALLSAASRLLTQAAVEHRKATQRQPVNLIGRFLGGTGLQLGAGTPLLPLRPAPFAHPPHLPYNTGTPDTVAAASQLPHVLRSAQGA
jgi:hypothetical protein